MNCICNHLRLPRMNQYEMLKCIKLYMSNGEEFTIKTNDLVGVQFIKDDKQILVRRGRIKDIVIVNRRRISTHDDNVSHIILDCSEQFTIKILEIKLKDIIKIGGIDEEFYDYSDRITELEPNFMDGCRIPLREHGMCTKEEMIKKVTKPERNDVVKMNPATGIFDDLYDMNQNRPGIDELRARPEEVHPISELATEEVEHESISGTGTGAITANGFKLTR